MVCDDRDDGVVNIVPTSIEIPMSLATQMRGASLEVEQFVKCTDALGKVHTAYFA